jgi:hypothetical protein
VKTCTRHPNSKPNPNRERERVEKVRTAKGVAVAWQAFEKVEGTHRGREGQKGEGKKGSKPVYRQGKPD